MKIAIMQPYFLPYIGYWQLLNAVDIFVLADNYEFTKKGWINRNRMLVNGEAKLFTLPLKKQSDFAKINERELTNQAKNAQKMINNFKEAYRKAPFFFSGFNTFLDCVPRYDDSMYKCIERSIEVICGGLKINTSVYRASDFCIDHELKKQDKIFAICDYFGIHNYVNAIGGQQLYDKDEFKAKGINLQFIKTNQITYKQFNHPFVPWLSIIDVLMFNGKDRTQELLNEYTLI